METESVQGTRRSLDIVSPHSVQTERRGTTIHKTGKQKKDAQTGAEGTTKNLRNPGVWDERRRRPDESRRERVECVVKTPLPPAMVFSKIAPAGARRDFVIIIPSRCSLISVPRYRHRHRRIASVFLSSPSGGRQGGGGSGTTAFWIKARLFFFYSLLILFVIFVLSWRLTATVCLFSAALLPFVR